MFSGVLDTKTLGGAGFASQKYRFSEPLNLDSARYSGLRFKLVSCDFNYDSKSSSSSSASSATRYSPPNEFTITLTTVPLPHQKPKSRVTWESHFEVPQKTGEGDSWAQVQTFKLDLPFESFSPVYRGRPVPGARSQPPQVGDDGQSMQYLLEEDSEDERPVFNTEHIYEFGLMCRSEFGKQEGQFCLGLLKVEAIERSGAVMSWMRRMSSSNSASG
ncbi:hypothetical protein M407DRAFT_155587 [Tulasnella calospora MUT 4182]|uniref:Uncharacterized protein n=1 Tax=Tulasnella calospora MUT 4182 TaxID=1051891 RepID=A0A0C3M9K8_9AGAM|nr:hypothetical protein M407DRAFT_155587 [Tulasnella calospora MUT 4182]